MNSHLPRAFLALAFVAFACGGDATAERGDDRAVAPDPSASVATSPATTDVDVPDGTAVKVYKPTYCGCCTDWVEHMERAGFELDVETTDQPAVIKDELGVPEHLRSCHTSRVGDYVIEGHVPADVIARLLRERPDVKGIAVPGMPIGSPGMEATDGTTEPYDIVAFDASGETTIYDSR